MIPGSAPSASEIEKKLQQKQAVHRFLSRVTKKAARSEDKAKLTRQLKRTEIEMQELKTALSKKRHSTAGGETRAFTRKHIFYF